MADLEENIFKENIPGRWSTFERREKSDVRLEDVEDEGEEVDENGYQRYCLFAHSSLLYLCPPGRTVMTMPCLVMPAL